MCMVVVDIIKHDDDYILHKNAFNITVILLLVQRKL